MRLRLSFPVLLASLAVYPAAAQDSTQTVMPTYVSALPLERPGPTYPGSALSSGKEGWVLLSFVISPTGDVTEPMIEDSSGIEAFERSALRAVEGWKYRPATQDGAPVEQAMTKTAIFFRLEDGSEGASESFVSKYRRITRLINEKDFAAAESLITELEFGARNNLYEEAWFWWTKYVFLASSGSSDEEEMRDSLRSALGYEREYLAPEQFVVAAERLFILYARALDFSAAMATFERLRDATKVRRAANYEQVVANLQPTYDRMLQLANGEDLLVIKGTVSQYDYWVHDLLRRSFSVADVVGRLDVLDIRCLRGTRRYSAVPVDTVWTVPESWGSCGAYIKGEPGTTFVFREHPRSFTPPAAVDVGTR